MTTPWCSSARPPGRRSCCTNFIHPIGGDYRFRVSASGFQSAGKPVTYRLDAGNLSMTGKPGLVGYFDAPADKPSVVEFVAHLEPTNTMRIHPYGLAGSQIVHKVGADKYDGPGLAVQWVEVEGPLNDTWPPESHRRIFGDLEQEKAPPTTTANGCEVVSKDPLADAERILRNFARRAFRRTVTDDDIRPFMALVEARLNAKLSVRAGGSRGSHSHPGFAGVPVPRRKTGPARRFCPGQPAFVFPVEHDARRGAARLGRARQSRTARSDDAPATARAERLRH